MPNQSNTVRTSRGLSSREYALLFTLVLLCYLPGVFGRDFWIYNEGRRAIIALEMLKRGDWLLPRLLTQPILTKPPLFYWAEAGAYLLTGGPSDWAARLPSLLAGVLNVLALAAMLARLFGRAAAWSGAMLLAILPVHVWMAGNAEPEMLFVALGTAAMWAFVRWWRAVDIQPWQAGKFAWAFWSLLGLSFFTKGPLVPLMVAGSVLAWLCLTRRRRLIGRLHPLAGALVLMGPFLLWALLLWAHGYPPTAFIEEVSAHIEGDVPHSESVGFYFSEMGHLSFPWWFVGWGALLVGVIRLMRLARGNRWPAARAWWLTGHGERLLMLLWFLISLVVLSAVPSKRYYYGLILMPAFAALGGMLFAELLAAAQAGRMNWLQRRRPQLAAAGVILGLVTLATAFVLKSPDRWGQFIGKNTPESKIMLLAFGVTLLGTGAVALNRRTTPARFITALIASAFAGFALAALINMAWIHPRLLNPIYSYKRAITDVLAHVPPGTPLFSFEGNHSLWFYTGQYDIPVLSRVKDLPAYHAQHPGALGVTFSEQWKDLREKMELQEIYRTNYIPTKGAQVILFRIIR